MNHYDTLEVSRSASQEVIKAAYRSLMQRYHPDRNPGDAEAAQRALQVTQAYEMLSDPARRAAYDQALDVRAPAPRSAESRARNVMAAAAREELGDTGLGWLWLLLIPAALVLWFALSLSGKGSSGLQPDTSPSKAGARTIPLEARTIPALFKDMNVRLTAPYGANPAMQPNPGFILSIQTVDVVAGGFDPDKFKSFMENNKEYIGQKLAEKLALANYDMLMRQDGEQYLKRFIVEAIGEITGVREPGRAAAPEAEQYGAVDVRLPDFYSVTSPQPASNAP